MLLSKIYSEPKGLFNQAICKNGVIEFHEGINYILGEKEPAQPVESLNGIGKSLLLDLIDFCLLASFQRNHNPRLYKARNHLSGYKIVLEFTVNEVAYIIKRSIAQPKEIEFGKSHGPLLLYNNEAEIKERLSDLIFKSPSYHGYYKNTFLRELLPFFLKIHKHKQQKFADPIEYIKQCTAAELNQYHLFLMGLDNSLIHQNYELQKKLADKDPALKEIERVMQEKYSLSISEVEGEVHKLTREIAKLEEAIKAYKLADSYQDVEGQANKLTGEIKELVYLNFSDQHKLKGYQDSIDLQDDLQDVSSVKIKNIYAELNELLANVIKTTLQDAIDFRNRLTASREKFLASEIKSLEKTIQGREKKIKEKEEDRAKLFSFLEAREAIKDLTEAFYRISEKKKTLKDLEGRLNLHNELSKEKADLHFEEKQLEKDILTYLPSIKREIISFREIFLSVYNNIYTASNHESFFSISPNFKTKAKISIEIRVPAMYSEGKNQGRTLVYDLAILLHAIKKNIKCPRFLVHDGVFDGMDKAHFVAVTELLHAWQRQGKRFQYIVPVNEEGTLDKRFGAIDHVTWDKMKTEAVVVLSPSNKLLGTSWA